MKYLNSVSETFDLLLVKQWENLECNIQYNTLYRPVTLCESKGKSCRQHDTLCRRMFKSAKQTVLYFISQLQQPQVDISTFMRENIV